MDQDDRRPGADHPVGDPVAVEVYVLQPEIHRQTSAPGGAGQVDRRKCLSYQAWVPPHCGQPTDVETTAWNTYPHEHLYMARSSEGPPLRRRANSMLATGSEARRKWARRLRSGFDPRLRFVRTNKVMSSNDAAPNLFRARRLISLV